MNGPWQASGQLRSVATMCFAVLLFGTIACPAQTSDGGALRGVQTLHVSSQLVTLDALVSDRKTGVLAQGLTVRDFTLSEDGVPQRLRYFSQDTLPLSIVLLFDLTDSVRPQLKSLGAAAEQVLAHLKPEDEVAVMTFDSSARLVQPFTTDRALAAAAVRRAATMRSGAPAFIDEAVYEAVDEGMKATLPNSRRVLVWMTDDAANRVNFISRGAAELKDEEIVHTRAEATEKLQRSGVVVAGLIERSTAGDLIIGMSLGLGVSMGGIQRYAEVTGGPVLKSSRKDAAVKLSALLEELRGRYTLGYVPSVEKAPGTSCSIKLELSPEALAAHPAMKRGRYSVRARSVYYR